MNRPEKGHGAMDGKNLNGLVLSDKSLDMSEISGYVRSLWICQKSLDDAAPLMRYFR